MAKTLIDVNDHASIFAKNEARAAKRRVDRLKREARALGFVLSPEGAAA